MLKLIYELSAEVRKQAIRRQKIADAFFLIGISALILVAVAVAMFEIGNLPPFVAKGAMVLGR